MHTESLAPIWPAVKSRAVTMPAMIGGRASEITMTAHYLPHAETDAPRPPIMGETDAPRPPILGETDAPRPPILGETDFSRRLDTIAARGVWDMDEMEPKRYGPPSPRYIPLRFPTVKAGAEVWHHYKAHRARLGGDTLYLFRDQLRPGHCRRVLVTAGGCIYMEDGGAPRHLPLAGHKYAVAILEIRRADIAIAGNIRRNAPGSMEGLPTLDREPIAVSAEQRARMQAIINYVPAPERKGGTSELTEAWN